MPAWPLLFLIVAIVAAMFGFTGFADSFAWIARVLFYLFMVCYVLWLLSGRWKRRR